MRRYPLLLALLAGCGGAGAADPGNGSGPFALGDVIDRAGRPLASMALVAPFEPKPMLAGAAQDAYNADGDPAHWVDHYRGAFATALAAWDGVDGTCGNQVWAGPAGAGRYDRFAAALADDQLYVDTGAAACNGGFFGVELGAAMTGPRCGGRNPSTDVGRFLLSLFITDGPSVNDGVAADGDHAAVDDAFPFLAPPN
jgi:hypothetical protein